MNVLPELFDSNPSLSAIFITPKDDPDNIYASLYEKNRIKYEDYIRLVSKFQENLESFQKNNTYRIFRFSIQEKYIYLFFQKRWNHISGFILSPSSYPFFSLFFVLYIIIFFILILWLIYDMGEKKEKKPLIHAQKSQIKKQASQKKEPTLERIPPTNTHTNPPLPKRHSVDKSKKIVTVPASSELVENRLKNLFEKIEDYFLTENIIYYSNENGKWRSILEKREQLYIKGESIKNLPVSFVSQVKETIIKTETREIFYPILRKSMTDGLLYVKYRESYGFKVEDLETLRKLIQSYSESLFIHKTYEKAVMHSESGFFTYPFLFFTLQEKANYGASFDLLHFKIPADANVNINDALWQELKKFIFSYLSIPHSDPKLLPLKLFHAEDHSIYLLIDYKRYANIEKPLTEEDGDIITERIKEILKKIYGAFIPASLTRSCSDDDDAHGILKRSRLEWELARENNIFGRVEKDSVKPAYETSA